MSDSELILYDIPSKPPCASWSHNALKTRMTLNYRKIPYKTIWIEYPDIAPTFKSLGVPPNNTPIPYTIPTVRLPDQTYIPDSTAIAHKLEEIYPAPKFPSLNPTAPSLEPVLKLVPEMLNPTRPLWIPIGPPKILNEPSRVYFEETRSKQLGMSLVEFGEKNGGEECWEKAEPAVKGLGELLNKKRGAFLEGHSPTYGDFVIVATLHMIKKVDEKIYERLVGMEKALGTLYDASKQWLERDDH